MSIATIVKAYLRTWAEWYVHIVLVVCRTSRAWWTALSPNSPVMISTAKYNTFGQLLTLYQPNGPVSKTIATRPAILMVHGGAWTLGIGSRFDFASHCLYLVRQGYTVATVSYRLLPKHPYPAAYNDLCDAVGWLSHSLGKPVLLMGHSAGGHLSLLVGLRDTQLSIAGVVSLSAPTDLSALLPVIEVEKRMFLRGTRPEDASPAFYAQSLLGQPCDGLPPFYIFHGDRDVVVPLSQAQAFVDLLRSAGARVHFHVMEGVGHWFPFVSENNLGVVDAVLEEIFSTIFPSPSILHLEAPLNISLL
ncbi:MAG: alpha/beta hydrolase [Vampirovibrionales bacterium]|nr:alpha/beta hydrolase [Vampirovibrionales bacterium]